MKLPFYPHSQIVKCYWKKPEMNTICMQTKELQPSVEIPKK